jgi:hypothetical protein
MERVSPTPEVVVLGNVGVDINVYLPGRDVDWSVEANFTENLDYVGQAGDALAVGFLTSHALEGRPLPESVRRGQLATRHCCSLSATSDGLITSERLE